MQESFDCCLRVVQVGNRMLPKRIQHILIVSRPLLDFQILTKYSFRNHTLGTRFYVDLIPWFITKCWNISEIHSICR